MWTSAKISILILLQIQIRKFENMYSLKNRVGNLTMELVKRGQAALTYEKLKALSGLKNLTEQQAGEIITALKLLVEIVIAYQHEKEQENKCKIIELDTIYKEAA